MRIVFKGTVQGVGFRPAVYRAATTAGLHGMVKNNGSDVTVIVDDGNTFLTIFNEMIPPLAVIESIEKFDEPFDENIKRFKILDSSESSCGVSVPTDTAICPTCLKEMKGVGRRSGYPFTSCTDCGPRFTLLSGLPYDREQTVMKDFPMCPFCSKEFGDPDNRRLHHQTICCPVCGPKYYLLDMHGNPLRGDPIRKFANNLNIGMIGIIKSWGGMHICCTINNIEEIRERYGRKYKPFAIMVRDMDSVKRYGTPTDEERKMLLSPHRPIVLISKKINKLTEKVSPGMDTIGIFLPYTGMQHLLFDNLQTDALIMTSANSPGEPMIVNDNDIMRLNADMYLLHDQTILNRADDSVVRIFEDNTFFIRRSRGNIPTNLDTKFKNDVVAVGAQENLTGSVAKNGKIYPTQHIGNGENIDVVEYLETAIRFNMTLTGCKPQAIAMDLHPGYTNRKFAKILAREFDAKTIEVQHHWAHAASLLIEHKKDNGIVLTLDGTGHGDDGQAWGGECMYTDLEQYKRLAHLEYIPLLGSEKALYDLRRLKFAIDSMNNIENNDFNENDASVLTKLMSKSIKTSSMGRLLDILAYTLKVCKTRTYDGEPAMRMEKYLAKGELIPGFETYTEYGEIKTAHLFANIKNQKPEDVAYSITYNVMNELIAGASEKADKEGLKTIGISGGVSYDAPICRMFKELVEKTGYQPMFHNRIPNGDGGISIGQTAIALKMVE